MAKLNPGSPFLGRWHIISMSMWDEADFNEKVQAFVEFDDKGRGSFQFGDVRGIIDYRERQRNDQPEAEFTLGRR